MNTGLVIPTSSQITRLFGHHCNPGPILPHVQIQLVPSKKYSGGFETIQHSALGNICYIFERGAY